MSEVSKSEDKQAVIERILCHYCYCVGQGAGSKWIDSEALGEVLDHFRAPLEKMDLPDMLKDWKEDKFFLLQLFREIGRVAAHESGGRPYIHKGAIDTAIHKVESNYQELVKDLKIEGRWCEWDT